MRTASLFTRKSSSWVTITRVLSRVKASWTSSVARNNPTSGVTVTSTPCRCSPSAIAWSTFSCRWKRIDPGITHAELLAEFRGDCCLERRYKGFRIANILLYRLTVIVVISERGMHLGQGQLRIMCHNLRHRVAQPLMPEGNILHPDTIPGNPGLSATGSWCRNDMLHTGRRVVRFVGGGMCFHTIYHTQELLHMPAHRTSVAYQAVASLLAGRDLSLATSGESGEVAGGQRQDTIMHFGHVASVRIQNGAITVRTSFRHIRPSRP